MLQTSKRPVLVGVWTRKLRTKKLGPFIQGFASPDADKNRSLESRAECLTSSVTRTCLEASRCCKAPNASQERVIGRIQKLPSNLPPVSFLEVDVCHRSTASDDYCDDMDITC